MMNLSELLYYTTVGLIFVLNLVFFWFEDLAGLITINMVMIMILMIALEPAGNE